MRRTRFRAAVALTLLSAGGLGLLSAQTPSTIPIERYTLPNGLRVILSPNPATQVVAVNVWYDVGSRNEVKGRTGFAHLFEHMMFQGSGNVPKGGHMQLIERAGGSMNGSTSEERTNYYQVLPSNRLNLGLWLEADRMRSLAITKENFENQRETVKEERRLRVDNQPYTGAIFEGLYGLADSTSCFPYAHSVIGSMDDLNAGQVPDVQAFFDLYYAPNNAILTVVGGFDPGEAKALITAYFGGIARGQAPPPVACTQAFNTGVIRRTWPDAKATVPGVMVAYRVPALTDPDYPALEMLAAILGQGESSRLNRSVVREEKLAQVVLSLMNPTGPRRGPGAFLAFGIANSGVTPDSLEAGISRVFTRIAAEGVTEAELSKAKNAYLSQTINQRQQALIVAEALQSTHLFYGDPNAVNTEWQRMLGVTVADVKRAAATYLRADNSLTLLITPEAK